MNSWRAALDEWVSSSPERRAVKDDHFDLKWVDVEKILKDLETVPLDWAEPLIIAGHKGAHTTLAILWALVSDGVGVVLERQQLATMLPRLASTLTTHNILIHEADLKGFEYLFRELGYDLGQTTQLRAFDPDPTFGRPLILSFKKSEQSVRCPTDCGWLLMTSGSTMSPKLVMIDRQDLVQRAVGEIRDFELGKTDVVLNVLPMSHDVGFNQVLSWVLSGAEFVVQGRPAIDRTKRNLLNFKVTGISGTPMMWIGFLQKTNQKERFPDLKYVTISGGVLPLWEIERLREIFPNATVIRTYGQTETFRSLIVKNPPWSNLRQTHGTPLRDVRISICDESGYEVVADSEGELIHEGVGSMLGYFPTPLRWRKIRTGDYFQQSEGKEYRYVGRRDDLIKRWEIRMHLSEVEQALLTFEGVLQACVISKPTEDVRQNLLAGFVAMSGVEGEDVAKTQSSILEYCKKVLSPSKIPDRIFLLRSFPETASRKLDRRALRRKWEEEDAK